VWALPGWLWSGIPAQAKTPEAELLAVGHGLAVVIQMPDGRTLLYDCGRLGDSSVGRRIIAPALWARGVSRIDTVLLSHADQDHYDGLPDLMDRFPVGAVRVPPGFGGAANPGAGRLIDQVRARGIPVRPIAAPETWEWGGVQFTVHHPRTNWHPETSDNARSLVLDVAYAGRHLLLTGDLEQLGLIDLVARPRPEPPPDVLLAPHHGGRSANPPWLYQWARPRLVVVSQRPLSSGAGDALSSLEQQRIPVLRTWRQGSIRLRWTGDGILTRGFLDEEAHPPSEVHTDLEGRTWCSKSALLAVCCSRSTLRVVVGLGGVLLGTILWAVLAVVEFGAWALVVPPRSTRNQSLRLEDSGTSELAGPLELIEVWASDGKRLAGRWYPALEPSPTGRTIVLLHGFAEDSSMWEWCRASLLNRHGWNVVAIDSRGYGRSEGPFASFGGREAGDVQAWLDAISERVAKLDPTVSFQPGLWGRSMGAVIALRAAAVDDRIASLVLESPLVDLETAIATWLQSRRLPFGRILARLIIHRAGKLAGIALNRPRPIELAPRVVCPTLIVHGTEDTLIPITEARRLAQAFPSSPCWFDVPGAAHHNVIGTGGTGLVERIAGFLDESTSCATSVRSEAPGDA
jgi:beta-lactamase superfamily II metal-dependent hydrolase/pimeloyl-ACP methyl ester carboxylesterase